jgi:transcriptional regulator with XRE-family HTH domain
MAKEANTMDPKKTGEFLAQLRKEQGLTQKELAEKLHVSDKAISRWETGKAS